MTSIALLIGGELANALASTGSSYLFSRLSKDSIGAERKRHNAAIEQLQKFKKNGCINDKSELTLSTNNSGWKRQWKRNSKN